MACGGAACAEGAQQLGCQRRKLQPRQHLFLQGDAQSHIYLVQSGAVCLYKLMRSGRRQIVGFKLPGEFIGLGHEERLRFCAQAMGPTELRCFALQPFLAAASGDPRFLLKLYESVSHDLSRAYELVLSVGQRDAGSSVAAFLLGLEARARTQREPIDFVALPMSRGDIADYLSISFETVSRVFTSFKKRGYIALLGRRGVRLIDRDSLRTIAMSEDSGMRRAAVS